jgi:hypothetical protein
MRILMVSVLTVVKRFHRTLARAKNVPTADTSSMKKNVTMTEFALDVQPKGC